MPNLILEILKPRYDISDKTKEYLKEIKYFIKSIRDERCEKNSEEYIEMNRYLSSMNYWDEKSINKSLKLYINQHRDCFSDYEDVEKTLKEAYDIRSTLIHSGIITDHLIFTKSFIF